MKKSAGRIRRQRARGCGGSAQMECCSGATRRVSNFTPIDLGSSGG